MPCTSYIHSPVYSFVGKLLHEAFAEGFFVLSTLGAMPLRAAIFVYLDRSRMLSAKSAEFFAGSTSHCCKHSTTRTARYAEARTRMTVSIGFDRIGRFFFGII